MEGKVINLGESARRLNEIRKEVLDIETNIKELQALKEDLKKSIVVLTPHEKYAAIRRRIDDLFYLYQDTSQRIVKRQDKLQRLKNEEQKRMDSVTNRTIN